MKRTARQVLLPTLTVLALLNDQEASANNIQVTNPGFINGTGGNATIQFDLSWENSWRGGGVSNWDAAWVFVKYRTPGGVWGHAQLNNSGHVATGGSQIDPGLLTTGAVYDASSNPVIGVFVYRNTDGTGSLALPATQLSWNYGAQGLAYNDINQVQVFAIEMVYVPQGAFAAGSGGTETNAFILTTINSANATTAPTGTGSLGGQAGGYPTGQTPPVSASWPNGFEAFYCMKYEVSQQGYVEFLNTLTYPQQVTRTATVPTSPAGSAVMFTSIANRNGIVIQAPGVANTTPAVYACNLNGNGVYGETSDGKDIACGLLSWGDLMAYLDWSGLRPMTELEFEKACRGTIAPVPNEYAWGTSGIASSAYTLSNSGVANEDIATNYSSTLGNASYQVTNGLINGPLRVGIFAGNGGNSGRVTSGASYYGIMELSGSLFEHPVNIGQAEGRAYTGAHGNGTLTANGDPNATSWPTSQGFGLRGGAYSQNASSARVSIRDDAMNNYPGRGSIAGGRGVRLAP